jgi:hypothetical protein
MNPYNLAVIVMDERVKPIYYLKTEHFYDTSKDSWSWATNEYDMLDLADSGIHVRHPEQFRNLVIERKKYE